jgi:hypothetical protein
MKMKAKTAAAVAAAAVKNLQSHKQHYARHTVKKLWHVTRKTT